MRVLFICTGCINRSASADVILRALNPGDKYQVKSCGTGKVAPLSKKMPRKMLIALEELGYDGSDHRSQAISEELLSWADTIVVMGNVHERFIADRFPKYSSKVQNWRIKDPHFEKGMDTHREVVRQIQKRIQAEFC